MEQLTGSKLGKEYYKAVSSHPAYLTSRQSESESEFTQSCLTLCDPMDYSLPGSSVYGIFQAFLYWSGLPFPSPEDLPYPETEPGSPIL